MHLTLTLTIEENVFNLLDIFLWVPVGHPYDLLPAAKLYEHELQENRKDFIQKNKTFISNNLGLRS